MHTCCYISNILSSVYWVSQSSQPYASIWLRVEKCDDWSCVVTRPTVSRGSWSFTVPHNIIAWGWCVSQITLVKDATYHYCYARRRGWYKKAHHGGLSASKARYTNWIESGATIYSVGEGPECLFTQACTPDKQAIGLCLFAYLSKHQASTIQMMPLFWALICITKPLSEKEISFE